MVVCYSVVLRLTMVNYICDQLRSIEVKPSPSHVYIGDDGSNDTTIQIILDWIKSTSILPHTFLPPIIGLNNT